MIAASLLFSVMNACVYAATRADAGLPATVVSFIRVLVNLVLLVIPGRFTGRALGLFGDRRPALWLRGLFGASALMLSFAAIARIGVGESAFLHASSGVFVALLGPWFLGQRNGPWVWLAIGGSLIGLALLLKPRLGATDQFGRSLALGSGWLAALAYLMVARSGRSNSPSTVVFYFCLAGVVLHLAYFGWTGLRWPKTDLAWIFAVGAGFTAAGAQLCMTRAYASAPAALLAAVGYVGPVFSLFWGVLFFAQAPDHAALAGCALILLCGIALPFFSAGHRARCVVLARGRS